MGQTSISNGKNQITLDALKDLVSSIESQYTAPPAPSSVPYQQKLNNFHEFLQNMDSQLFKIFKQFDDREINIDNSGNIRLSMQIDPGSDTDIHHKAMVKARNHGGTKLDAVDGEGMFIYLFNPIFEALEFDTRINLDGDHYEGMGDNGDFKYGTRRIDIKTRQKKSSQFRYNLLINKPVMLKGFNEFGLVHREGDLKKTGQQRRLTFLGYVTEDKVLAKEPVMINRGMKYEIQTSELDSLRLLISRVLLEVLEKEEK